jgi:hypothetical protein
LHWSFSIFLLFATSCVEVKEKKLTNLDEATIRDIVGSLEEEEDEAKAKAAAKNKGKAVAKARNKKNGKQTQNNDAADNNDDDDNDALQTFAKASRGKQKKR